MAYRRTGLSAYPTDSYYDPGRPSWLPYWIDDTIESQNKAAWLLSGGVMGPLGTLAAPLVGTSPGTSAYANPPAPPTIQPPNMAIDPTGAGVSVDDQIAAQVAAENVQLAQFAGQQNAATPVDNFSAGAILNKLAAPSSIAGGIPNWMILAGVGGVLYLVIALGGRR